MSIERNLLCFCGSGLKQKKCHPDVSSESRVGQVLNIYKDLNNRLEQFYSQSPKANIACHSGCYSCCYDNFTVTDVEFKLIARELKSWDTMKVRELYNTVLKQLSIIKERSPEYYQSLTQNATFNQSIVERQIQLMPESSQLPCPLLDQISCTCMVYPVRPLICRLHGTTNYTMNTPGSICSKISDVNLYLKDIYDAREYSFTATQILEHVFMGTTPVKVRTFPIVWWLKIILSYSIQTSPQGNIEVKLIDEDRDFRLPIYQAQREFVKKLAK